MKKKFIDVLTEVVKGKKTMLNFTRQYVIYMDEMGLVKYFFLSNKDFRMRFDLSMQDLLSEDEWGYYQEPIKQFSFHAALDKMANGDLMRRTWMAQTGAWVYAVHDKLYLKMPLTGTKEWNPTISDMQANDWVEVKL